MKRDLLAEMFLAFQREEKQSSNPVSDSIATEPQKIVPPDAIGEIIRQVFADYEDESKFEIPW